LSSTINLSLRHPDTSGKRRYNSKSSAKHNKMPNRFDLFQRDLSNIK
jgi:hypothetical protein